MNQTQKILGIALLIVSIVALAFALAEIAPSLMDNAGSNAPIAGINWHDLASVGWVTAPL
jgi:hypothetical protein